ncbi:MAG: hypothetical protein QNJ44_04730 [Rhodobacter sp.]|nr:hypothetical protein [Rhodobacter sp.]
MDHWEETYKTAEQAHWSSWTARPKKNLKASNYFSALVFATSAFLIAANYGQML